MEKERSNEGGGLMGGKDRMYNSRSSVWRRQGVTPGAVATEDVVGDLEAHKTKAGSFLCAVEVAIIQLLLRFELTEVCGPLYRWSDHQGHHSGRLFLAKIASSQSPSQAAPKFISAMTRSATLRYRATGFVSGA